MFLTYMFNKYLIKRFISIITSIISMGRTYLDRDIAVLKKEIIRYQKRKKRILSYVENINNKYLKNEITPYKYQKLLNQKVDGKTLQGWINYCDSYIKKHEIKIKKRIRKLKRKKFFLILSSLFIISLFFILNKLFIIQRL